MTDPFTAPGSAGAALPVFPVTSRQAEDGCGGAAVDPGWAKASGFSGGFGEVMAVPGADGSLRCLCLGIGDGSRPFCAGALAGVSRAPVLRLEHHDQLDMHLAAVGFGLGAYRFTAYRKASSQPPVLHMPDGVDGDGVRREVEAVWLARDLVNTPAGDMGPDAIEAAAQKLAKRFKATFKSIVGDDLLAQNFPMIHAVGRASAVPPRLIDIRWGRRGAPRITLVGKGVAFDTGGLDIKPASGMRNMKKDMGGAANVLALASMIMDARLDVRLRVLIPAVENAISGNAFRPGDVLASRKGPTVEIGNTDAEGRLVLADALALADEEKPEMIIDMATLTGAARVALGPEIAPFYTTDEGFAAHIEEAADACADPVWRMPLWQPYASGLSSTVADMNNITTDGFAGSVTAALFLQRFVEHCKSWTHFDIFAWNPSAKPHAPVGGEAQGPRALYKALARLYG